MGGKNSKKNTSSTVFDPYVLNLVFPPILHKDTPTALMSVDEARKFIANELATTDDIVLAITPGAGKSYATNRTVRDIIETKQQKRVIFACLTNFLADQTYAGFAEYENVIRYKSRCEENCEKFHECKIAMNLKQNVIKTVCKRCDQYKSKQCEYLKQLDGFRYGTIICTHAAVPFVEDKIKGKIDLVIFDETPVNSIISTEEIDYKESILLKNTLFTTAFWRLLKSHIDDTAHKIAHQIEEVQLLRLKIGPDVQHIEEIKSEGYEGYAWGMEYKDHEVYRKAQDQAQKGADELNA